MSGISADFANGRRQQLLDEHQSPVRRERDACGEREIDNSGDGFLATFDVVSGGLTR